MKRLIIAFISVFVFGFFNNSMAKTESNIEPQIERIIVGYFEAVQNKNLKKVAGLMTVRDPKILDIYQTAFMALDQKILGYKIKKVLQSPNKAIVLVESQWQIVSKVTNESFTPVKEDAFLFEKNKGQWKIVRILPEENLDLFIKNYFLKKSIVSGNRKKKVEKTNANNIQGKNNIVHIDKTDMFDMEYDTDRPGLDYKNFNLPSNEPMLCQRACDEDPKCKAWTFVKPNTVQGPNPRCWLKYAVPKARHATCCISGVKTASGQKNISKQFKNSPYTEKWFYNWKVVKIPKDASGSVGKINNSNEQFGWKKPVRRIGDAMPPAGAKGAALYLHPVSPQEPTVLHGVYRVNSPEQELLFRIAGNTNGDWLMVVNINGVKRLERIIDGKKWYEIKIPLKEYVGQNISVDLYVKANGWFFEYAFIDEIKLTNINIKDTDKRNSSFAYNESGNKKQDLKNKCQQQYKEFVKRYNQLTSLMSQGKGDTQEAVQLYEKYKDAKNKYEKCKEQEKKSENKKNNNPSAQNTPKIIDVQIATRAISQNRPDPNTVTNHLPKKTKRFYLFVFYENFTPHDRIDMFWYFRPQGSQKERLVFQQNGGKVFRSSGVFSAPVELEDSYWPNGFYRILFRVNNKEQFEKHFRIGVK